MNRVYVGVGSNIDNERNIRQGIIALKERFGKLDISPVYESEPVGFQGKNFYNLVVGFDTCESPEQVAASLRDIESSFGRNRKKGKISRTLDLDLLLIGDLVLDGDDLQVPRMDILNYAFVLKPLAELDGDRVHPVEKHSFRELWNSSELQGQDLWKVDIELD